VYPGNGTDDGISYTLFGLLGEAGELANKWKKYFRDDIPLADTIKALAPELGDVLWYVANMASELGYSLEELAQGNLDKLAQRQHSGTLNGSGDHR
jgi:NTP pyrophosphatase (non-canonical NTP hydrolase)